ncbi:MAG TPA: hypothetical protein DIC64_03595 [Alphaproteobacteria bacterium]|nr:hypothetical protein [Alphaproteobacteria bacterium]
MFEPKKQEKLRSTDLALYDNKLKLDEFQSFDPFEMTDLNGLKVLASPRFEPYYKVVMSLKVTDDNGQFLQAQTETLKKDIVKASKQETFLELLYLPEIPEDEDYFALLEEKLLINLVNLVLDVEIPSDRTLDRFEIATARSTFEQMLKNA